MTQLRHFDSWGTVRFVTFSCHQRLPILGNDTSALIVLRELDSARRKHGFKLFAYVIMPEHVHIVLLPTEKAKLGMIIGELKSLSARVLALQLEGVRSPLLPYLSARRDNRATHTIWLPRCHDHNCRNQETVLEKINYCHFNPVKRKLSDKPEGWKWSSYKWYTGVGDVVIELDTII